MAMDTLPIQAFSRNGPFGRWTIICGRIVAMTLIDLYFASRGRVLRGTCRDPILVQIVFLELSPSIEEIKLPFLEKGLELLSDYVGEELRRLSTCDHMPPQYPMAIVVLAAHQY